MRGGRSRRGMVLIFALWVLGILTVLAVSVAAGIRQKIFLVARLDERSRMEYLLEAAVKKTAGYIHQEMEISTFELSPAVKTNLYNNTNELSDIRLRLDSAGVGHVVPSDGSLRWGVVDEESKLNINKTDFKTLANLLSSVLSMNDEDASNLAHSLLDWRLIGESEISGFYSDDYYSNLQYPYPKKNANYETMDEMLLVKGVTKKIYSKLLNYLTIYGDGTVNINTTSKEVLEAMGLPETLAEKIMTVRRGRDTLDATMDDHVFMKTFEIAADVNALIPLSLAEARAIDILNMKGLLSTDSFYYTIEATGKLADRSTTRSVRAVYSSRDDKIIYWNER
jgi:general secretion pathway protein K